MVTTARRDPLENLTVLIPVVLKWFGYGHFYPLEPCPVISATLEECLKNSCLCAADAVFKSLFLLISASVLILCVLIVVEGQPSQSIMVCLSLVNLIMDCLTEMTTQWNTVIFYCLATVFASTRIV